MEHFTQLYGKEEDNTEKNMYVATKSIQQLIDNVKIMGDWKGSILIVILKKRDRREPENYQVISLMNSTLKLL